MYCLPRLKVATNTFIPFTPLLGYQEGHVTCKITNPFTPLIGYQEGHVTCKITNLQSFSGRPLGPNLWLKLELNKI